MKNTKSQIQYNWIFVIIAGAVILAFFIGFSQKYIDLQNKRLAAKMAVDIDEALNSLRGSQVYEAIDLGLKTNIDFDCNSFMINEYFSKGISEKLIFGPSRITGKTLLVWVQPWKYPYRVDNFFYTSGDNMKYYLIYDGDSLEFVKNLEIPKIFDVTITDDVNSIEADNNEVKAVFFTQPREIGLENAKTIEVISGDNSGIIKIEDKEYPYFGNEMLYGAIFSDNYGCLLDRSLKSLEKMTDIYSIKTIYLWRANQNCDYASLKNALDNLKNSLSRTPVDVAKVIAYVKSIDNQNRELSGMGCVALY